MEDITNGHSLRLRMNFALLTLKTSHIRKATQDNKFRIHIKKVID